MQSNDDFRTLKVSKNEIRNFKRLDVFLNSKFSDLSRTFIKKLFEKNLITTDSNELLSLKKMPQNELEITLEVPPPPPSAAVAQNLPLEILYEDEHLVFINKEAGRVTHPAPGNPDQTLVNALLYHIPELQNIDENKRPGIVHRLDKGTSGVMVVAKNRKCHEELSLLFQTHDIVREYQALCWGDKISLKGTLESTLGRHPTNRKKMEINVPRGKFAKTHYHLLESFHKISHLKLTLETGRTHQIRVHLSRLLKCPLVCDSTYGHNSNRFNGVDERLEKILKDYPYPLLHARKLGFIHPFKNEPLEFQSPPPKIFKQTLEILKEIDL